MIVKAIATPGVGAVIAVASGGAEGSNPGAAIALNRNDIAFVRGGEIYVIGPDGRRLRKVVRGGDVIDPAWSSDRKRIAFMEFIKESDNEIAFERDAGRDGPRAIFKVRSTGGAATRITTGGEPDWSPDGKWIAFTDHGDIYIVRSDGSGRRLLIGGAPIDGKPRWSPDGTKMGFVRARKLGCAAFDCVRDLWIADRSGRNQRLVVRRADFIDW